MIIEEYCQGSNMGRRDVFSFQLTLVVGSSVLSIPASIVPSSRFPASERSCIVGVWSRASMMLWGGRCRPFPNAFYDRSRRAERTLLSPAQMVCDGAANKSSDIYP